jgi:transposase
MRGAFRYRLWTNASHECELAVMLESHRRLYNACLEQRKTAYQTEQRSVKYTEQSAWFKAEGTVNPFFARLNFSSAQATMRRLDRAFQAFFRRRAAGEKPGYPRFKGSHRFDSIEFPACRDGIRLSWKSIPRAQAKRAYADRKRPRCFLSAGMTVRLVAYRVIGIMSRLKSSSPEDWLGRSQRRQT